MYRVLLGIFITAVIAGCGGGSGSDSGSDGAVDPSVGSYSSIEEVIYVRNDQTIPSQDKTYIGDYSSIDIDATAADNGFSITEVYSVSADITADNGDEIAGNQVFFNDGSILEFGCDSSSITFPEDGRLSGTFLVKHSYDIDSRLSKVTIKITDKQEAYNYNEAEYGGIINGDYGNPEFIELGSFEIITYGAQAPLFEVGKTLVAPLTDIKVERIVKFSSYSLEEDRLIPFDCYRERVVEKRKPLPAFDPVGPSWNGFSPYSCWDIYDTGITPFGATEEQLENCPIWKAEKGW